MGLFHTFNLSLCDTTGLNPNLFPLFGTQYLLNVSQVLRSTDKASIRKHKLSTELVIWLSGYLVNYRNGLHCDLYINDAVTKLEFVLGGSLAVNSINKTCWKFRDEPLEALFHLTDSSLDASSCRTTVNRAFRWQDAALTLSTKRIINLSCIT